MDDGQLTTAPLRIVVIVGTRPEAIKLMPVIAAARARPTQFEVTIIRTGQHREMVDDLMEEFGLHADFDLRVMRHNQDLAHVLSESLRGLSELIERARPDWVLVQGDTATTFAGALAAFHHRVRVGHVEAGLRTGKRHSPFPEETYRSMTARLADLHFAPTEQARANLLTEGIPDADIVVTGNTVVDALMQTLARSKDVGAAAPIGEGQRYILVTAHRRESHGPRSAHLRCDRDAARPRSATRRLGPDAPEPERTLGSDGSPRQPSARPPDRAARLSGIRAGTRRCRADPDRLGRRAGRVRCARPAGAGDARGHRASRGDRSGGRGPVGTDTAQIVETGAALLDDAERYRRMARASTAFGSGSASTQILDAMLHVEPAKGTNPS
jgi:UDP-N-acetylglucosamine 2-epimerase (non-hydrolysing)